MTVSEVGLIAIGTSNSLCPLQSPPPSSYQSRTLSRKGIEGKREDVRSSNPSYFRSESFDMIFFSVQDGFRDEHWEISVIDSQSFTVKTRTSFISSLLLRERWIKSGRVETYICRSNQATKHNGNSHD